MATREHRGGLGMIERFNGRISEVLAITCCDFAETLTQTIERSV